MRIMIGFQFKRPPRLLSSGHAQFIFSSDFPSPPESQISQEINHSNVRPATAINQKETPELVDQYVHVVLAGFVQRHRG